MDHMGIVVIITKLFSNKQLDIEPWYCSSNPDNNMQARCHPAVRCQFFRYLDCIFLSPITLELWLFRPPCPDRVQKKYSGTHVKVHSGSPFR